MYEAFNVLITKFKVNDIEKYKKILIDEKIDDLGLDLGWKILDLFTWMET